MNAAVTSKVHHERRSAEHDTAPVQAGSGSSFAAKALGFAGGVLTVAAGIIGSTLGPGWIDEAVEPIALSIAAAGVLLLAAAGLTWMLSPSPVQRGRALMDARNDQS
jgi:hypothetical protein